MQIFIRIGDVPSRLSNDHLVTDTGEGMPQICFLETDGDTLLVVRRVLPHHRLGTTGLLRPAVFLRAVWTCWCYRHSPSSVANQPCAHRWSIEVDWSEEICVLRGRTVASSRCHALSWWLAAIFTAGSHCWSLRGGRRVVVAIAVPTSRIAVGPQVWRELVRVGGRIHQLWEIEREPREKILENLTLTVRRSEDWCSLSLFKCC